MGVKLNVQVVGVSGHVGAGHYLVGVARQHHGGVGGQVTIPHYVRGGAYKGVNVSYRAGANCLAVAFT